MAKRKGETLVEFITAVTIFGVMMGGILDFIANQTQTMLNVRDRDDMIYEAHRFMMISRDKVPNDYTCDENSINFKLLDDGKTLKLSKGAKATMTFRFKP